MELDFLEQGLVMLKVASTPAGMETQDAHEDILVIGQVGHSLDILDVGMLHQKHSLYKFMTVHTSTYYYILVRTYFIQVHTSTYKYIQVRTSMYVYVLQCTYLSPVPVHTSS